MPLSPARYLTCVLATRIFLFLGLPGILAAQPSNAQPKSTDSPTYAVPVFVENFELHSVPAQPRSAAHSSTASGGQKSESPLVYNDADSPSAQAVRLMDFFAASLLQTLHNKGFRVARPPGQKPSGGALIRGVFAEPDAKNRIRRALLGGSSPSSRFLLYVGIFNLGRQEQPLYQVDLEESSSSQYGPVITLNNYIPLAKYELDKNPSEEDVQKICNQIAASLMALLESNPNAFSH